MDFRNKGDLGSSAGRQEINEALRDRSASDLLSDYSLSDSDRRAIKDVSGNKHQAPNLSDSFQAGQDLGPLVVILLVFSAIYKFITENYIYIGLGALCAVLLYLGIKYGRIQKRKMDEERSFAAYQEKERSRGSRLLAKELAKMVLHRDPNIVLRARFGTGLEPGDPDIWANFGSDRNEFIDRTNSRPQRFSDDAWENVTKSDRIRAHLYLDLEKQNAKKKAGKYSFYYQAVWEGLDDWNREFSRTKNGS